MTTAMIIALSIIAGKNLPTVLRIFANVLEKVVNNKTIDDAEKVLINDKIRKCIDEIKQIMDNKKQ